MPSICDHIAKGIRPFLSSVSNARSYSSNQLSPDPEKAPCMMGNRNLTILPITSLAPYAAKSLYTYIPKASGSRFICSCCHVITSSKPFFVDIHVWSGCSSAGLRQRHLGPPPQVSSMASASSSLESMPSSAARSEVGRQRHIQVTSGALEAMSELFEGEALVPLGGSRLDFFRIH